MRPLFFLTSILAFFANISNAQTEGKVFFSKEFNWTINIPAGFESVSAEESARMQNKGLNAIEETIDGKVVNQAKLLFSFKSDQFNYFEANYQPFDTAVDGNYLESCRNVNNVVYETFSKQIPGVKIDSSTTIDKIDNLTFHTFRITIDLPNDIKMNLLMFSRLFGKREFTVNVLYVDKKKGEQMLTAWKNSRFR